MAKTSFKIQYFVVIIKTTLQYILFCKKKSLKNAPLKFLLDFLHITVVTEAQFKTV